MSVTTSPTRPNLKPAIKPPLAAAAPHTPPATSLAATPTSSDGPDEPPSDTTIADDIAILAQEHDPITEATDVEMLRKVLLDLARRLEHTPTAPLSGLHLTTPQATLLYSLLGHSFTNASTADELLTIARRASTVNVHGIELTLVPELLVRLKSRCHQSDFAEWLRDEIRRQLAAYAGW